MVIPNIKSYHKSSIIRIVRCWHKNGKFNQWNRVESRIGPSTYGNPVYGKGGISVRWEKDYHVNKWSWHSNVLSGRKQNHIS